MVIGILYREWGYLWYYFTLQLSQTFHYWVLGAKRFALYLAFTTLFAPALLPGRGICFASDRLLQPYGVTGQPFFLLPISVVFR